LSESELEALGVLLGHRKKLLHCLAELSAGTGGQTSRPGLGVQPALDHASTGEAGERRQLTVLFCDMVGFTELANRVDPEILQRVIRSYEDACAVCITRYEGYVFQRLGDGIVAFFGYPLAHEGEAERAIHAGLAIIEALSKLGVPEVGYLQVRIGIATGLVVVSSAEKGAVGAGSGKANFRDSGSQWSGKQTAPVASFAPNRWGLCCESSMRGCATKLGLTSGTCRVAFRTTMLPPPGTSPRVSFFCARGLHRGVLRNSLPS
jgi:hypothetical protein